MPDNIEDNNRLIIKIRVLTVELKTVNALALQILRRLP